jgi:serine/threonine-protein kinase RsbW
MATDDKRECEFDARQLILRLELTIPGEVKSIDPVVRKVIGVAGQMGCAAGKEFEIETALREALANAIVHGCKEDPGKEVEFVAACDESRGMMIVVRDPGPGFDPAEIPSPVVGQRIYSEHGRGIYLINQLMDEVRIEKGGTQIYMRKD